MYSKFGPWFLVLAFTLAGCSSPPDPPQPVGTRIAVNPVIPTSPNEIKAVLLPELRDL